MQREDNRLIFARLDDYISRADRGEIVFCGFLSPRELRISTEYLDSVMMRGRYLCHGGYRDAERKRIYFLPEYLSDTDEYAELLPYLDEEPTLSLEIRGSGYRRFSHRDLLGSLLSLGIERDVLGDIVFEDGSGQTALLFCDRLIAEFVMAELSRVANDAVKIKKRELDEGFVPYRSFLHISDTVSSARIDAVVAALCSLSREKARAVVESELVEVDFAVETRADRQIAAPCTVSVRGQGRFRVNSVSEHTRKGRLRLDADKYL